MIQFRFIPFRNSDIISMCCSNKSLKLSEIQEFKKLCDSLQSILHLEFHFKLESLKNKYSYFDPDSDFREVELEAIQRDFDNRPFIIQLEDVLNKANYEKIPHTELELALQQQSLFKIRLQVDFSDFSEVLLYCRGENTKTVHFKKFLGLSKHSISFTNYERVVIYLYQKNNFSDQDTIKSHRPKTFLKLFKNVPKADLEMLFPNTKIRMRTIDKLMIAVPAALSGGIIVMTKLGATFLILGSLIGYWLGLNTNEVVLNKTTTLILLAGLGTLVAYLWKQFSNFKNKKLRFMKTLTDNLYFKNLDNNAGVIYRIINDAEEQEVKEMILAYYFLYISGNGLTESELDTQIESWLDKDWQCKIDFEIKDALAKLEKYQLVKKNNNVYSVESILDSLNTVNKIYRGFI